MDSIWNKDLNIECETIKLIEQVVGEYYCDLEAETLKPSNQVSVNWKKKKKKPLYTYWILKKQEVNMASVARRRGHEQPGVMLLAMETET